MKRLVFAVFLSAAGCFGNTEGTDTSAPVVVITSPTGTIVAGTVVFSAGAVDDYGVEAVDFYAGTVHLLEDRLPPYEVPWGTGSFPDGDVQIRVIAKDYSGNTAQAAKTVTIDNAPN